MQKKYLMWLVISTVLSGCDQAHSPPEPDSRPVKLFTVSTNNARIERHFPATSEAGDTAALAFRVPGQLQSLNVLAGQWVPKGTVLARLNADEYQLLAQKSEAQFRLADVQYQRYKKLRKDSVVSEQEFDQAKANHNAAKATLEQARANLRYTTIVAPYDGTISRILADDHTYIAVQQDVMHIQTNQFIKVMFQLPDHLLNHLANGDNITATMIFDAYPQHPFPLTFQEVATEADPQTGSYQVTMVMSRPKQVGVLPGMAGMVRIAIEPMGFIPIPPTALFEHNEQMYVWQVDSVGRVTQVPVELNDKQQVQSGLKEGDQIIISGIKHVRPDMKVRAWIKERGL